MTHRLIISYDGLRYAGWQRQLNATAVQQVIEEALGEVFDSEIRIHGAGRTDAGVHARGQVAHLKLPRPFPAKGLVHATNHRLPSDIRILGADRMPEGFHARKSASAKMYVYRIQNTRVASPLDAPWSMVIGRRLAQEPVRRALEALPGRHDFSAFALAGGSHGQPWRRILGATLDIRASEWVFRFVGEGFLRGMVRALTGTLVEIGLGDRPASDMARLLEPGHKRGDAGFSADAKGLCLEKVFYPPGLEPIECYRP